MSNHINNNLRANGTSTSASTDNETSDQSLGWWRSRKTPKRVSIITAIVFVILLTGTYWLLWETGSLATICDTNVLEECIARLGLLGPFAIIGLMAGAIVLSPIPSAPIALAAGAAFGHIWGTIYVLIGAEIGALVAFTIARLLGYEVLQRWFKGRLSQRLSGSQNTLMAIVFVTRLVPFISFDVVSYAAGLTPLAAWRFAVATLAGMTPASFILTHFGGEMASADTRRIVISLLVLGGLTLVPVAIRFVWLRRQKRASDRNDSL